MSEHTVFLLGSNGGNGSGPNIKANAGSRAFDGATAAENSCFDVCVHESNAATAAQTDPFQNFLERINDNPTHNIICFTEGDFNPSKVALDFRECENPTRGKSEFTLRVLCF